MSPSPQQAIVIGAGSGIGRSLALRLAKENFDLALLARNTGHLELIAEEVRATGRSAVTVSCDAADPEAVAATVASLAQRAPTGVLTYNAAAMGGRLIDTDPETLQRATNVNVLSPIAAVRAALSGLEHTQGTVLLTGGGLALHPNAAIGVLSLGKAGLRTVAHLLADDLAPRGVRVRTLIITGIVAPGGPFDPDTIADAFWALQADPDADVERVFSGEAEKSSLREQERT
ncbi:MAG: SDR family NAD(P)-dependent oxidoreductase [Acidimicrobiales bacterium]